MVSPRQQIANLYWQYPQPRTFDTDEHLHRVTGYVIESDDYFLMGRGVDSTFDEEMLTDPAVAFPRSCQDCWFIWAYCGPLNLIYDLQPYILPIFGGVRRGQGLRIYGTEEFQEKVCASKLTISTILTSRAT